MKRISSTQFELCTLPSGFNIMIHQDSHRLICKNPKIMSWFRPHIHITRCGKTSVCISLEKYNEYFTRCAYHRKFISLSPMVLNEIYQWMISQPTDPEGLEYDSNYEWSYNLWEELSLAPDDVIHHKFTIDEIPDYRNISMDKGRFRQWQSYTAEISRYHFGEDGRLNLMIHRDSQNCEPTPHFHIIKDRVKTVAVIPMTDKPNDCCLRFRGEDISINARKDILSKLTNEVDGKLMYNDTLCDRWAEYHDMYDEDDILDYGEPVPEVPKNVIRYLKGETKGIEYK